MQPISDVLPDVLNLWKNVLPSMLLGCFLGNLFQVKKLAREGSIADFTAGALREPRFWAEAWSGAHKNSLQARRRRDQGSLDYWNRLAGRFERWAGQERTRRRVDRVLSWLEGQGVLQPGMEVLGYCPSFQVWVDEWDEELPVAEAAAGLEDFFRLYTEVTPEIKKAIAGYVEQREVNGVYSEEYRVRLGMILWTGGEKWELETGDENCFFGGILGVKSENGWQPLDRSEEMKKSRWGTH